MRLPRGSIFGILIAAGLIFRPAAAEVTAARIVVVTNNGWHTGIVVARADLPRGALPETRDFPAAIYFEFGWGDREYYPAPRKTLGMTLGAALPSPAVMHVIGLDRLPATMFPGVERIRLSLTENQFVRLVAYLDGGFDRRGAARVHPSGHGLYTFSLFYPATGSFHLFNTCNTWVARALVAAGLPIRVSGVQSAEDLMIQVRRLALPP